MIITAVFGDGAPDVLPARRRGPTVALSRLGVVSPEERALQIVGAEGADGVHTIDMWWSSRRRCWTVERRDPDGSLVGHPFHTSDEHDAAACLVEWLRSHDETHLVGRAVRLAAEAKQRREARAA